MAEPATSPSKPKRSQGSRSAGTSKARGSTGSGAAGASRSSASRSKSTSGSRASRSSGSRPPSSRSAPADRSGGGGRPSSRAATAKNVAGPVARASKKGRGPLLAAGAAAAAAAGGALLKRQRSSKGRKILGVSTPKLNLNGVVNRRGLDVKPIGREVARAGDLIVATSRRVSKLSGDAERVGRTAKKLGDSIS